MSYGAGAQVPRMLAMVPYLRERAEVPVDQVARDFGVSRAQVVKDLGVLWFCGLPEAVTGEMIDVDMDALDRDGVVRIDNAEFLPRPLRLTVAEALSLIVALRTLRDATGSRGRDAVEEVEVTEGHDAEHVDQELRVESLRENQDQRHVAPGALQGLERKGEQIQHDQVGRPLKNLVQASGEHVPVTENVGRAGQFRIREAVG